MTGPRRAGQGPLMGPGEEWMACRVCRRSLERLEDVRGGRVVEVVWDHTQPDRDEGVNHAAEPVPYSEIGAANVRLRCDFCLTFDPVFELPVTDFDMPMRLGPVTDWGSSSSWSCCDACADLINRGDWPRLTRRAAEASAMRNELPLEAVTEGLKTLYRQVRKHQAGPVRLDPLRARLRDGVVNTDGETRRWR